MTAAGSLVIVYPLDFARTRLAADLGKDGVNREFKGLYDCLAGTMRRGGPFAVYQGFMTSMVMFTFYRGLYFGLYDTARDTLAWEHPVLKWCAAPHPFHLSKILRPFSCPSPCPRLLSLLPLLRPVLLLRHPLLRSCAPLLTHGAGCAGASR